MAKSPELQDFDMGLFPAPFTAKQNDCSPTGDLPSIAQSEQLSSPLLSPCTMDWTRNMEATQLAKDEVTCLTDFYTTVVSNIKYKTWHLSHQFAEIFSAMSTLGLLEPDPKGSTKYDPQGRYSKKVLSVETALLDIAIHHEGHGFWMYHINHEGIHPDQLMPFTDPLDLDFVTNTMLREVIKIKKYLNLWAEYPGNRASIEACIEKSLTECGALVYEYVKPGDGVVRCRTCKKNCLHECRPNGCRPEK
ncbi:hypothetical protein F5Y18DRAFT_422882 [Xylariaceae sp. FL1019]|nr:hypothetical protein F5Y18DRAFT_422882 [Xylariaceae sp. FL1019]